MLDADMGRFIKLDKDDFVGKEASLQQKERAMQLIYFAVEAADADVLGGEPLFAGEQCVGPSPPPVPMATMCARA